MILDTNFIGLMGRMRKELTFKKIEPLKKRKGCSTCALAKSSGQCLGEKMDMSN